MMSQTRLPLALQFKAKKARKSVVHILVEAKKIDPKGKYYKSLSSGTGFIVRSNNKGSTVLTAAHVLKNTKEDPRSKIYVRQMIPKGKVKQFEATVFHASYTSDVAVLKVPSLKRAQSLKFSSSTLVRNQSAVVVAYSNPHGFFRTAAMTRLPVLSPGQVVREKSFVFKNEGISTEAIKVDCVAMPGMSGGPVLGMTGVMGLVTSGRQDSTIVVCNGMIAKVLDEHLQLETDVEPPLEELISRIL